MALPRLISTRSVTPMKPERQDLAAAIDAWREANRTLTAINTAITTADDVWYAARATRTRAEAAVETAKQEAAEHLTASALGNAGTPPTSVRAARAALVAADDDVDAAKAALDALRARQTEAEMQAAFKNSLREDAARAVIRASTEAAELVARIEYLLRELTVAGNALRYLEGMRALNVSQPGLPDYSGNTAADIVIDRLRTPADRWIDLRNDPALADRRFSAWFAALLDDANASLPSAAR